MKTLKVSEDAHTATKVAAAKIGRSTSGIATAIILRFFDSVERGEIRVEDLLLSEETV